MKTDPAHAPQRAARIAHAAWAAVCVVVCLLLVFTGRRGHPPAVILLPVVLVGWAIGHGLIWGVLRLAAQGRRVAAHGDAEDSGWPLGLRLAAGGTGAAALVGVVQVVGTALTRKWYPFQYAGDWAAMLVVWLLHAVCLTGLLLRRRWSRPLSAALAFGWAALLGSQAVEHIGASRSADPMEILIAFGLGLSLLLFGAYLALSSRVRSFLRH